MYNCTIFMKQMLESRRPNPSSTRPQLPNRQPNDSKLIPFAPRHPETLSAPHSSTHASICSCCLRGVPHFHKRRPRDPPQRHGTSYSSSHVGTDIYKHCYICAPELSPSLSFPQPLTPTAQILPSGELKSFTIPPSHLHPVSKNPLLSYWKNA